MQKIITFVSDFGLGDTWVGMCHAVIHRACPQARVVDLDHQVPPYDIRKGAAVAASGVWQLPEAIHLVVVDPGVGGGRHDLCVLTGSGTILVGPDNGVLIPATWRSGGIAEAYSIVPESLNFKQPLATFHARDILAPAAAVLACGVEPSAIGSPLDRDALVAAPFEPCRDDGGVIVAEVLDIDRFGSVRIAISPDDIEQFDLQAPVLELSFGHLIIHPVFARTFSDVGLGEPICLVDSSGWLTLAVRTGSAAERFGIESGEVARVRPVR